LIAAACHCQQDVGFSAFSAFSVRKVWRTRGSELERFLQSHGISSVQLGTQSGVLCEQLNVNLLHFRQLPPASCSSRLHNESPFISFSSFHFCFFFMEYIFFLRFPPLEKKSINMQTSLAELPNFDYEG